MDRLTLFIAVSDVLLDKYKTGSERARRLKEAFGADGEKEVQAEVTKAVRDDLEPVYMAVACIADHYGSGKTREKALGRWAYKVQQRINAIDAMRGKSITQAAKDVINGNYDRDTVRILLLTFCGYDAEKVQAEVNRLLESRTDGHFRIHAEWFFRQNEDLYGDCTAIFQYDADGNISKCVLIDTAQAEAAPVVIEDLRAQGVKQIDAVILSHAHGDHYGGLSAIIKAFPVKWLYLPDTTELDKYQKGYGNKLRQQAKKVQNVRWIKQGESFQIGEIKGKCLFICPAAKLSEHDYHHFVNNQSTVLRFDLGGITYHTAGDLQNDGNNLLINSGINLKADIFKCQWHGDANACNQAICNSVLPTVAFSNYHHLERSGRGTTRTRLETAGATVYRNAEDGHIDIDCINGNQITVTTSKSKRKETFKV